MKKVLAIVLACTLMLGMTACGGKAEDNKLEKIKEAGVLVLGTSADYPPGEFHTMVNGEDTIIGYDIMLAQYIADDLGVELKVVDMAFDGLCMSLSQGEFDIVISGMTPTEERKKAVDFTDAYYTNPQLILVKAENADLYTSPEDLAGKKVGVQNGTIQVEPAKELAGEENVVSLVKNTDLLMELQSGKLDALYIDSMPATAFANANDDLVTVDIGLGEIVKTDGQAIGVQKGNESFLEYLNGLIAKMQEDGVIDQYIADAWELAEDAQE